MSFLNHFHSRTFALCVCFQIKQPSGRRALVRRGNVLGEEYVSTHYVRNAAPDAAAILFPGAPRSVFIGIERRF